MLEDSGPDLFDLAVEADCLAAKVRNARCCDALRPCRTCQLLRTSVLARRIVSASGPIAWTDSLAMSIR